MCCARRCVQICRLKCLERDCTSSENNVVTLCTALECDFLANLDMRRAICSDAASGLGWPATFDYIVDGPNQRAASAAGGGKSPTYGRYSDPLLFAVHEVPLCAGRGTCAGRETAEGDVAPDCQRINWSSLQWLQGCAQAREG
jgi:hypothetical protein